MRAVQGHQLALEGSLIAVPFWSRTGMDAKTRDLALLTGVSFICAGTAWILDYLVLGSVFFALGIAAILGMAWEQSR